MYKLFPLVLCLIPVHSFYAQNIGEISFKNYIDAIIKLSLLIIGGVYVFDLFTSNINSANLLFSLTFFALINAGYLFMSMFSQYQRTLKKVRYIFLGLYILALCIILGFLYYFFLLYPIVPILISKLMFGVSFFISFFILLDIVNKLISLKNISNKAEQEDLQLDENLKIEGINIEDCPDIYHIILDSHSGFNNPKYSDEYFKAELEKRGFHICKAPKSNYYPTRYSLPSLLNLNYIDNFYPQNEQYGQIQNMWVYYEKSKLFKFLKKIGYKFVCVYSYCFLRAMNHSYIEKNDFINKILHMNNPIINLMIVFSLFNILELRDFKLCFNDTNLILSIFNSACLKTYNQPTFYYMHLLAPHPPYLKDENGNDIPIQEQSNLKYYMTYQKYINKQILKNIDTIQKNMKKKSLIILHSDHSISIENDIYNILFAIYSPQDEIKNCIPDNLTLVNMYRYVFNKLFNSNFKILPNRYFSLKNYRQDNEYLEENFSVEG